MLKGAEAFQKQKKSDETISRGKYYKWDFLCGKISDCYKYPLHLKEIATGSSVLRYYLYPINKLIIVTHFLTK